MEPRGVGDASLQEGRLQIVRGPGDIPRSAIRSDYAPLAEATMSSPDRAKEECDAVQLEIQALLIDRERPARATAELWTHLAGCDACARSLGQDRALRRALERLRGAISAPALLRERLRRLLCSGDPGRRSKTDRGRSGGEPRSS